MIYLKNKSLKFIKMQEIVEELEAAGWKKAKSKKVKEINSLDIKAIFNLVDVDRSGSVSRTVRYWRNAISENGHEIFLGGENGSPAP